ncbi:DUF7576 family protein [Haloarcula litorea]|uniref:DUF7576 family protein n=1 Tax=Haloarcula litorea TaxID=3032579 RepID=UPI0023E8604F|nr:hypothetical protein [Halomicroarcula sp. GDY20]
MPGDTPDDAAVHERWCDHCGSRIDPRSWHPVAAPSAERYRVHHFCSESCRERWYDGRE